MAIIYLHEDNSAMISVAKRGANPTMRHLGCVHGISVNWIYQGCSKDYVALGYMLSDQMAANIHTKAFPEDRKLEWIRNRQNINVFDLITDDMFIGRPGHGFVNLQDRPQNYASKDTALPSVSNDLVTHTAAIASVPPVGDGSYRQWS